jgi:hypothetical protein
MAGTQVGPVPFAALKARRTASTRKLPPKAARYKQIGTFAAASRGLFARVIGDNHAVYHATRINYGHA